MPAFWIDAKIMKDRWNVYHRLDKNLISASQLALQIGYHPSEILFLMAVVERKDHEIRCNKEDDEQELQSHDFF